MMIGNLCLKNLISKYSVQFEYRIEIDINKYEIKI